MNALQLAKALTEVLRDYHATNNQSAIQIKDTILGWYYSTMIQPEECVALLVEFFEKGTLSIKGKLRR